MDELPLDDSIGAPGFRLDHVELFGWGTFDRSVWRFDLARHTSLLTGDIGSGKSTLVDAITTLLLPAQRISYNKAAGAETRERNLRSYVLGYYKSERSETTGVSKPVGLRDHRSHSAVLAVFRNERLDREVTLAQVFWMPDDHAGQPSRIYLVAERELSIAADLSGFGSDISTLRRRVRGAGITPHSAFPDYERTFRRALGIPSTQAMELFHQTVSMKSVGNLNDFVRAHMLEPFDAAADVRKLIEHFEDLTAAHDSVTKARAQLAALKPIVDGCDDISRLDAEFSEVGDQQRALRYAGARLSHELLGAEHATLTARAKTIVGQVDAAGDAVAALRGEEQGLRDARAGHAGGRVGALEEARQRHTSDREDRAKRHRAFNADLDAAGLDRLADPERFAATRATALETRSRVEEDTSLAREEQVEVEVAQRDLKRESTEISAELRSLGRRRSSIPRTQLELRERLCADVGIRDEELPFVGELVQVRPEYERWAGAAERVLHGFALSLIVGSDNYAAVARWVDGHHLGARLVYHRVRVGDRHSPETPHPGSLAARLELRDGPYAGWLAGELAVRAAHQCVESTEQFQRVAKAVTVQGQVKSGSYHEKDDRRRLDDLSGHVLGWDNTAKKDALIARGTRIQEGINAAAARTAAVEERLRTLQTRASALTSVLRVDEVRDLDWWDSARRVEETKRELALLRGASVELAAIEARLVSVTREVVEREQGRRELDRQLGGVQTELRQVHDARLGAEEVLSGLPETLSPSVAQAVEALRRDGVGRADQVAAVVEGMRAGLDQRSDALVAQLRPARSRVERAMDAFRRDYPAETSDMDASIESANEFREFCERVSRDDLPRFEADFKRYLNHNTIREIAAFQARLNHQADQICQRVATINGSLRDIDYNTGRFIRLDALPTPFVEIREFRADLRACTEGALLGDASDELYSEKKFEQVRAIISRFRGREGLVEHDKAWTGRVTDVRNWFVFNASERWRESDQEHEVYADSDGKSGGQKEKLAYTILAASLAYQFGLDAVDPSAKTFRFAVIDEAFGRGSDDSTRFALRLFARLGLQLLVVTPLQKVHIIEPFVQRVGFVDNPSGASSRLHTLTIAEYRAEQHRASAMRASAAGRPDPLGVTGEP